MLLPRSSRGVSSFLMKKAGGFDSAAAVTPIKMDVVELKPLARPALTKC